MVEFNHVQEKDMGPVVQKPINTIKSPILRVNGGFHLTR